MKSLSTLFIALFVLSLGSAAYAASFAGEDSARHYKSAPEEFDGKHVDIDCIFVSRINGGPQIEGVTFFIAHTKDDDNQARGGSIVVAVLSDKADSFLRKYGDTLDVNRGASEKVDSKRLRGMFHQLDKGHVYIDVTGGDAHELILTRAKDAKAVIGSGDGASAGRGKGPSKRK